MADIRYVFILALSCLSLLWERLYNRLWACGSVVLFFIALSLLNIPQSFDAAGHLLFLAVFAVALVITFLRTGRPFIFPARADAERHMEKVSALEHRPLETLNDRPIDGLSEGSLGLWRRHLQQTARYIDQLRIYTPQPDVSRLDKLALRHAAVIFLVIGLVVAQGEKASLLRQALTPDIGSLVNMKAAAFDLWITPPEYTHEAAVFLATSGQGIVSRDVKVQIPEGSILKLRMAGYRFAPKLRYAGQPYTLAESAPGNFTLEMSLQKSGELRLTSLFSRLGQWPISVMPDMAPEISLSKIEATPRAATKITYTAHDDHGITKLSGIISSADPAGGKAYRFDIPPDHDTGHTEDLTAHPWAGLPVTVRLEAEDAAGHKATSAPGGFILPERTFTNPTAKTLIEARKSLLRSDNPLVHRAASQKILDIASQPSLYKDDRGVFLSLSIAGKRLIYDDSAEAVQSVQELLWNTALKLEDGGLSLAQRELRDSLQKMSSALSDKNLSKQQMQDILDDVQKKMQQYIQSLATEMQQRLQQGKHLPVLPPDLAQKFMKTLDLGKMLEQMRQLSQMDSRERLQKMAESLQNSLDNLDLRRFDEMQEKQMQAMQSLQDLEDIIHSQQALFDKTNKTDDPAEAKEQSHEQSALRRKLGDALGQLGGVLEDIPDNLAKASQSMKLSEYALGKGKSGGSLPHQKAALDELQKGLDHIVSQMAQSMQQMILSFGLPSDGGNFGKDYDPLGRGLSQGDIKIPEEKEQRRVQEIIEELRNRSNEPNRDKVEREYIDRLLDDF